MIYSEFLNLIGGQTDFGSRKIGPKSHVVCCPAHGDKNPSLSVTEANDGRILLKCHAGCTTEEICIALGITVADLFPSPKQSQTTYMQPKRTEYCYTDEKGIVLFKKVRIEPGFNGQAKSFYSERQDSNGVAVRNLHGCRRVLYRLPELLKSIAENKTVFLVEGEKDADGLLHNELATTTTLISSEWGDEFTATLKNADVVVLFDMDKAGYKRRDMLCTKLFGHVKRLRVVALPGLEFTESHGKDVSDWLAMGHTIHELIEITNATVDYDPRAQDVSVDQKGKFRAISLNEFLKLELPKQEMLLLPFLPTQGLAMLHAKRGIGKTHVALGIAYAVATGGTFLKWSAPVAKKVLYIDGEMPAISMQDRLRIISGTKEENYSIPNFLQLITPDLQDEGMPDLATKEGWDAIEEFVEDSALIILDNLSCLLRSGVENEAESWQPIQDLALKLRKRGKSVLFVHHSGKNNQQRGTSKREDILDAVINIKHPEDYKPEHGAYFTVSFEKTRHFAGDDAASFQARLKNEGGVLFWEVSGVPVKQEILEVVKLKKEGLTNAEVEAKTGLSRSQVETRIIKAREKGLLPN